MKTVTTANMENVKQWTILGSGATSNFLMTNAHTSSVSPTDNPTYKCDNTGRKQSSVYAQMHVGLTRLAYCGQKWTHNSKTGIELINICRGTL